VNYLGSAGGITMRDYRGKGWSMNYNN